VAEEEMTDAALVPMVAAVVVVDQAWSLLVQVVLKAPIMVRDTLVSHILWEH
jgi:hypothetical protein